MTKLINNHVIFSFDNPYQIHSAAKFYRYLDTLSAMGYLAYTPKLGKGYYKGEIEPCVMVDYNDFFKHVKDSSFVANQESFLILNPRNPRTIAMQGTLLYAKGYEDYLGDWKEVSHMEAMTLYEGWTYLDGKYFTCV